MDNIIKELYNKKKYYDTIKKKAEKSLIDCKEEGYLRVSQSHGYSQFYYVNNPKDCKGIFIKKQDMAKARKLAQRDYDKKAYACADKWQKWIDRAITTCPKVTLGDIYTKSGRRVELIDHFYEISDEAFVKNWEATEYEKNTMEVKSDDLTTNKGEIVRSKAEKIIADMMFRLGIPYRYEAAFVMKDGRTVYPDFTILDVKRRRIVLYEHFGIMDDPNYARHCVEKISGYEASGFWPGDNFLFSFETASKPVNTRLLEEMLARNFL